MMGRNERDWHLSLRLCKSLPFSIFTNSTALSRCYCLTGTSSIQGNLKALPQHLFAAQWQQKGLLRQYVSHCLNHTSVTSLLLSLPPTGEVWTLSLPGPGLPSSPDTLPPQDTFPLSSSLGEWAEF